MVFPLALAVAFGGCTGTRMNVKPDPASVPTPVSKKCGRVAVKEATPDRVYGPAGNLVPEFAKELERSALFEEVYYPTRPDDQVDLTLDAKFNARFNPNNGSNFTKSFLTGLTLFLLEPVFWFDYYYDLDGVVDIYREKAIVKTINAGATAEMGMKFFSFGEAVNLERDTLTKAKLSMYKQMIKQLDDYCGKK